MNRFRIRVGLADPDTGKGATLERIIAADRSPTEAEAMVWMDPVLQSWAVDSGGYRGKESKRSVLSCTIEPWEPGPLELGATYEEIWRRDLHSREALAFSLRVIRDRYPELRLVRDIQKPIESVTDSSAIDEACTIVASADWREGVRVYRLSDGKLIRYHLIGPCVLYGFGGDPTTLFVGMLDLPGKGHHVTSTARLDLISGELQPAAVPAGLEAAQAAARARATAASSRSNVQVADAAGSRLIAWDGQDMILFDQAGQELLHPRGVTLWPLASFGDYVAVIAHTSMGRTLGPTRLELVSRSRGETLASLVLSYGIHHGCFFSKKQGERQELHLVLASMHALYHVEIVHPEPGKMRLELRGTCALSGESPDDLRLEPEGAAVSYTADASESYEDDQGRYCQRTRSSRGSWNLSTHQLDSHEIAEDAGLRRRPGIHEAGSRRVSLRGQGTARELVDSESGAVLGPCAIPWEQPETAALVFSEDLRFVARQAPPLGRGTMRVAEIWDIQRGERAAQFDVTGITDWISRILFLPPGPKGVAEVLLATHEALLFFDLPA